MTDSIRGMLIEALEQGDELGVRRLRWYEPYEAYSTWWAPRQQGTPSGFVVYAKVLGDCDPAAVLNAFRALADDFRPTPAAVLGYLNRAAGQIDVHLGRGRDRASTPEAIAGVAAAIGAGDGPCSCPVRPPGWRIDPAGVLRCHACGGIEQGQVYAAEDAAAVHESSSTTSTGRAS